MHKLLFMKLTPFQKKVYALCSQIPQGKISTYKILAEQLNTKAYRAVGQALNKNPFAPKVPCHRVVASMGTVGGFAHGRKAKKELLEKEGIQIQENTILNFEKILFRF